MTEHEIQTLLRQRSGGEMPKGYAEALLSRFQERQRSELLRRSAWQIVSERVATFWSEHSMSNGTYTLAMAALVAISAGAIFMAKPRLQTGGLAMPDGSVLQGDFAKQHQRAVLSGSAGESESTQNPLSPLNRQLPLETRQVSFGR
jgi:hypothetical protein